MTLFKNTIIILLLLIMFFSADALAQNEYKSPGKAFFYSLVFPGLGEKYVGELGMAKYFIAAEALMIGCAIGTDMYSGWLEEDYRAFAANHAGISLAGKNKDYFVEISRYNSIFVYNEFMRQDRSFNRIMAETPDNIWIWDTVENRRKFYSMRVDADNIKNRTTFFYSGVFLNHIISGIHAAFRAKRYNAETGNNNDHSNGTGFKAGFNPLNPRKFFTAVISF
ncbi:hypothetical protein ACFL6G_03295 [candidate division KSB1 bacterium]